jgi:hypothetical protein
MTNNNLDEEILELTIKLNNALKDLQEEGNGFIDKNAIEKVFSINRELEEKIKLKNNQ